MFQLSIKAFPSTTTTTTSIRNMDSYWSFMFLMFQISYFYRQTKTLEYILLTVNALYRTKRELMK